MIGVALTLSKAFVCGLAIYAFYHGCDPLKLGLIQMADQVQFYFNYICLYTYLYEFVHICLQYMNIKEVQL